MRVPESLRIWFFIHFVVDMIFAIPLIFFPVWTIKLFGLFTVETIMPRLVGAALLGIGGASFFNYNKSIESYDIMLTLKLLWSGAAIIGLLLALITGAPAIIWFLVLIFVVFFLIWLYYKRRIG